MSENNLKKILLEREIQEFEKENDNVYTLPLSDLVMMQMTGDFDNFLEKFSDIKSDFENASKMIEKTRGKVTTHKLFPSIVQKTIEAQLGDKHAVLRELGQNAIDSYELFERERPVLFDISKNDRHLVLRVRDYGCGMSLGELVRDLLIPYNSGKEFDLTKIGEHGIGWYSIMDLADIVKVTTRTKDSEKSSQALIYNDKNIWKTTINPSSENGFHRDLHKKPHGTEVCAFIPHDTTSRLDLTDFLFQHLGMVDTRDAQIIIDKELVNSIRKEYQEAAPVNVSIKGKERPLTMGVSKRGVDGILLDHRFKHRNKNLKKILYTQRGLFIKHDSNLFKDTTIHSQLMNDLIFQGLDFWVDVPEHITLTKGRNNIIADHNPQLLDGMYEGFENLFLDVLLNDEELLYHQSNVLLGGIAKIFDKNYSRTLKFFERSKYGVGRRVVSRASLIGSGAIDLSILVGQGAGKGAVIAGKGIGRATKYTFATMPKNIGNFVVDAKRKIKKQAPELKKDFTKSIKKWTPLLAIGPVPYGAIALYEAYGWTPFKYMLIGAGATAGLAGLVAGTELLIKEAPVIKKNLKEFINNWKNPDYDTHLWADLGNFLKKGFISSGKRAGELFINGGKRAYEFGSDLVGLVDAGCRGLLHKCGLYINLEEKRERKREKQIKKISKKYNSKLRKDHFLRKIMSKKIIPAEFYFSPNEWNETSYITASNRECGFLDLFSNLFGIENKTKVKVTKSGKLEKRNIKLSIDDIVNINIRGKLKYKKTTSLLQEKFSNGDFFVDYKNPIVQTIVNKIDDIRGVVGRQYDVKILEDHLDNILWGAKEFAAGVYFLSGVGTAHLIVSSLCKNMKNPFENSSLYQIAEKGFNFLSRKIKNKDLAGIIYNTGKNASRIGVKTGRGTGIVAAYIAASPFLISYYLGKATCKNLLIPTARALNPQKYPEYFNNIRERLGERKLERQELRRKRRIIKKEVKRRKAELKEQALETKTGFGERLKERMKHWYRGSALYELFGYGILYGESFDNLNKNRLRYLTGVAGVGQAYVDFVDSVEKIDALISKAVKGKRYNVVLGYKNSPVNHISGFRSDKKRKLHIDFGKETSKKGKFNIKLDQANGFVHSFLKRKQKPDKILATEINYQLLDLLLHQRAHDFYKEYGHECGGRWGNRGLHQDGFYETKAGLRRKVIDYLEKKGIELSSYIKLPAFRSDELDSFYYINPGELSELCHMTGRRLRDERISYDKKKQSEIEENQAPITSDTVSAGAL